MMNAILKMIGYITIIMIIVGSLYLVLHVPTTCSTFVSVVQYLY